MNWRKASSFEALRMERLVGRTPDGQPNPVRSVWNGWCDGYMIIISNKWSPLNIAWYQFTDSPNVPMEHWKHNHAHWPTDQMFLRNMVFSLHHLYFHVEDIH